MSYLSLNESTEQDLVDIVKKQMSLCGGHDHDHAHSAGVSGIEEKNFKLHYFPVVDSHTNMNLLFMVSFTELK